MKNIDFNKPVKLKNPSVGEEELVYKVVNYNKETERCYIEPVNLKNWKFEILPQELVSTNDIENV